MFGIGLLYLLFEKSIIVQSKSAKTSLATVAPDTLSRAILGAQVGLVALAMLVTRSSVTSLQAKKGLPLGTQIVGWFTLGTYEPSQSNGYPYGAIIPGYL